MEERNVYAFRNGAETRTMEYGCLETGEAYVTETGRGDITEFCYDTPARETTLRFRENEQYSRMSPIPFVSTATTSTWAT